MISLHAFAKRRHGGPARLSDAVDLRALEDAEFDRRHPAAAVIESVFPSDPRIGMLNGGRFYAYVNGYSSEPVIGSLADVEKALGIAS